MYFPLSQITTNLYTSGEELFYISDERPYTGFYFKTSDGKYYTGKNPNDGPNLRLAPIDEGAESYADSEVGATGAYSSDKSFSILPPEYSSASSNIENIGQPPSSSVSIPTEDDYEITEYERYFLKKNNQYSYKEINYDTFIQYKDNDPQVQYFSYEPLRMTWNIKGKAIDVYRLNKNIVKSVEDNQGWLGFVNYFKFKFCKYYRPSKEENYYTAGKELKILKTSEEYIGFYHIHPNKGTIMEGKNHKSTFHNTLILIEEGDVVRKAKISYDDEVGTSRRRNIPRSTNLGGGY
jgi:hypothetical protein